MINEGVEIQLAQSETMAQELIRCPRASLMCSWLYIYNCLSPVTQLSQLRYTADSILYPGFQLCYLTIYL